MTNPHQSAAGRRPSKLTKQQRAAAARKAVIAVAAAILVTVGVVAFGGHSTPSSSNRTPTAFSLPALNGSGRVTLTQFRGKPTVVNFFASWCSACDSELPGFKAEADALKGRVNFVGVDSLETGDKNYMPRRHHLIGSFAALAQDVGGSNGSGLHDALGGGNTMPLTAFYDSNGTLLDVERTALVPASVLTDKIQQLYHLTGP